MLSPLHIRAPVLFPNFHTPLMFFVSTTKIPHKLGAGIGFHSTPLLQTLGKLEPKSLIRSSSILVALVLNVSSVSGVLSFFNNCTVLYSLLLLGLYSYYVLCKISSSRLYELDTLKFLGNYDGTNCIYGYICKK